MQRVRARVATAAGSAPGAATDKAIATAPPATGKARMAGALLLAALAVACGKGAPVATAPGSPSPAGATARILEAQALRRAARQEVLPSIWRPRVVSQDDGTTAPVGAYLLDGDSRAVLVSPGASEIEGDIDDLVEAGDAAYVPAIRGIAVPRVVADDALLAPDPGAVSAQTLRFLAQALQRRGFSTAGRSDLHAVRRGRMGNPRHAVLAVLEDEWSAAGDAALADTGIAPLRASRAPGGAWHAEGTTFTLAKSFAAPIAGRTAELSPLLPSDRFEEMLFKAGALTPREPMDPVFVDDGDGAFESVGEWETIADWPHAYGGTARLAKDAGAVGGWTVMRLRPGRWAVWAKWRPDAANTTRAELRIYSSGSERPSVVWTIDQTKGTHGWNRLGDWVASTSRPLLIELRSGDGLPFVADAFAFEPLRLAKHDPIRIPGESRPRDMFEEAPEKPPEGR
jgi:hypothetical protein